MKAHRATYALLHEKTILASSKQRPSWPSDAFGIHGTTRTLDNNGSVTLDYRLSQNKAVDRLHETLSQCHARFPVVNPLTRMTARTAHSLFDRSGALTRQSRSVKNRAFRASKSCAHGQDAGPKDQEHDPRFDCLRRYFPDPRKNQAHNNSLKRYDARKLGPSRPYTQSRKQETSKPSRKEKTSRPTEQHQNTAHQYRQSERNPPTK